MLSKAINVKCLPRTFLELFSFPKKCEGGFPESQICLGGFLLQKKESSKEVTVGSMLLSCTPTADPQLAQNGF